MISNLFKMLGLTPRRRKKKRPPKEVMAKPKRRPKRDPALGAEKEVARQTLTADLIDAVEDICHLHDGVVLTNTYIVDSDNDNNALQCIPLRDYAEIAARLSSVQEPNLEHFHEALAALNDVQFIVGRSTHATFAHHTEDSAYVPNHPGLARNLRDSVHDEPFELTIGGNEAKPVGLSGGDGEPESVPDAGRSVPERL